jgi:hypothetical protein
MLSSQVLVAVAILLAPLVQALSSCLSGLTFPKTEFVYNSDDLHLNPAFGPGMSLATCERLHQVVLWEPLTLERLPTTTVLRRNPHKGAHEPHETY